MLYKVIRKLVYNLLWVLYPLTYIIPRKKEIWVFGSNFNKYNDNSKYLFEYVSENLPAIDPIWITGSRNLVNELRNKGLMAEWRYSFKGMLSVAQAGAFIYCHGYTDVNMWLKRGALKLNLWHGVGYKKIGASIDRGPNRKLYQPRGLLENIWVRLHSPQLVDKSFYLLATSKITKANYSNSFCIPENKIIIAGYPRLTPFFIPSEPPEDWLQFNHILIYAPTFRDHNPGFLNSAIPDAHQLNEACKSQNALFVMKLHPITPIESTERFNDFSNIVVLDNKMDIYPLLKHTSCLITDYSSIFVDYAVLEKPVIIYAPDLEDFLCNSRDFYFGFDELTGGNQLTSFDSFLASIGSYTEHTIPIKNLLAIFWERDSRNANKEISSWVKFMLENQKSIH